VIRVAPGGVVTGLPGGVLFAPLRIVTSRITGWPALIGSPLHGDDRRDLCRLWHRAEWGCTSVQPELSRRSDRGGGGAGGDRIAPGDAGAVVLPETRRQRAGSRAMAAISAVVFAESSYSIEIVEPDNLPE
jgi:hypothetical protein